MSHSKFVALAVLAAVPFACSRDRDPETPEGMTPASGQWPAPTATSTTTSPPQQGLDAPMGTNAPSGSDTTGNPHSSEADRGAAPDTIGSEDPMATGGTSMGGTTSRGGASMGGTTNRGTGGRSTGGTGMGGTSAGGTTGTNGGSRMTQ